MKKKNVFSIILCIILLLVFAMIFVGCDFFNAGVNNSNSDGGKPNNSGGTRDCTHTSTRWITDEEATCTTTGSEHKECSSCGKTLDTESISAKGHDYDETIVPPTEEQQGYTLHQCSRCGDNYKDNFVDYEYTEAEYKQMFETNLLTAIQNDYNEDCLLESSKINNCIELKLINYETGDVYFTGKRKSNGIYMFIATHNEITNYTTYKALYENCPTDGFEYGVYTVQEDDLAEEIVEFALTLPEIQDYIEQNNLDLSNYTVINATEFKGTTSGTRSDILLLTEDGILSFYLIGTTGYCSTQEEYLEKIKDVVVVDVNSIIYHLRARVEGITLTEYYEIPVVTE